MTRNRFWRSAPPVVGEAGGCAARESPTAAGPATARPRGSSGSRGKRHRSPSLGRPRCAEQPAQAKWRRALRRLGRASDDASRARASRAAESRVRMVTGRQGGIREAIPRRPQSAPSALLRCHSAGRCLPALGTTPSRCGFAAAIRAGHQSVVTPSGYTAKGRCRESRAGRGSAWSRERSGHARLDRWMGLALDDTDDGFLARCSRSRHLHRSAFRAAAAYEARGRS
jgi:hypothetical protein